MAFFSPYFATRRWLRIGLPVAGAAAGVVFSIALTIAGKIVGGAPPATLQNYAINAAWFGGLAAIVSPTVSWSALRRVPLWRTVVEPLALAVAGCGIAAITGSAILFLILPPVALVGDLFRLSRAYPQDPLDALATPVNPGILTDHTSKP
ncbi:MAG TPA: hypothetical protein VGM67_06590 [Gemmatimonadaceae bacterium]|jgi:hypothetical protein